MLLHASPHACLSVSVSASTLSSVGLFCVCSSVSLYHQGICAVGPQLKPYPQDLFELQLGATCHAKIRDDVTHVVSTAKDTNKMHWAKQHSRHRVSPNWLFVSGRQNGHNEMNVLSVCAGPCHHLVALCRDSRLACRQDQVCDEQV